MIKVALLAPIPYQYDNVTSGVPKATISLARSLKKYIRDVEVTLVSLDYGLKEIRECQTDFGNIYFVPTFKNRIALLYLPDILRIRSFLKTLKPDVVHSQGFPEFILAGELSGIPHVATLHGIILKEAKTQFWPLKNFVRTIVRGGLEQLYIRKLKTIISISDYVRRYVAINSHARIHSIDNAIDERFFTLRSGSIPGFILQVGSIVYRKGAHLLIDALALLGKSQILPQVHLVGSMKDYKYVHFLQTKILKLSMQNQVFFHDSVSDDQLDEFYRKAEIVCLPSFEETSPLSIAQAMAVGKTIIASDCGGIPDLLKQEQTGFLFRTGSSKDLSDKLQLVLNRHVNTMQLQVNAKEDAFKRFHPESVAKKTRDVYYSMLKY